MNTAVYKTVHWLATQLMAAAEANSETRFNQHYQQLQALCLQHQNSPKDHPVQWETLADFTDDSPRAIELYQQALTLANALQETDYSASISLSLCNRLQELQQWPQALAAAQAAKTYAAQCPDRELQQEIEQQLQRLSQRQSG